MSSATVRDNTTLEKNCFCDNFIHWWQWTSFADD